MKKHLVYIIPIALVIASVLVFLLIPRGGETPKGDGVEILIADGDHPYTGVIIYDGNSAEAKNAAGDLRLRMNDYGLANLHGIYTAGTMSVDLEIIVGASDREISGKAMALLEKNIAKSPDDLHWCFAYQEGKISIVASSADAYEKAIRAFFESYLDGGALRLPDSLILGDTLTRVEFESQFLLGEGKNPSPDSLKESASLPYLGEEYDAGQGSSLYVMRDAEIWEYTSLRRSVEGEGFVYIDGGHGALAERSDERKDDGRVHPYFYSYAMHAYTAACTLAADDGGFPNLVKDTVPLSAALKVKTAAGGSLDVLVRTEKAPWHKCETLSAGCADFSNFDFTRLDFYGEDSITLPLRERERGWCFKQFRFAQTEIRCPFGIYALYYAYTPSGTIKP